MKPYYAAGRKKLCGHKHRTVFAAIRCFTTRMKRTPKDLIAPVWYVHDGGKEPVTMQGQDAATEAEYWELPNA